jgi:hypothetical protein
MPGIKGGIPVAKGMGMDNNINKATFSILAIATVIIAAIAAKVRATANAQAPVGYEDESGFHFGSPDFKS